MIEAIALAAALQLNAGDLVQYTLPGTTDVWCMRLQTTYTGPDGQPWAWLTHEAYPARLVRVPVEDLRARCKQ